MNGGNDIVQIVITRNCNLWTCSNCTQLLPFRKDAREMTLECVEEALLSLAGWPGVIACFGGNPCTHSRFVEVCRLWQKHVPDQRQRGLWTNDVLKYADIVKEVFGRRARYNLNVHGDLRASGKLRRTLPGVPIYGETEDIHHAGILIDRRDYGIPDQEWKAAREACDINRKWSSAIKQGPDGHPRAYFCEVASSIDGVTGEDNGVPAVPGWWRQPMAHFQHQVDRCCDRGCGVPLRARGHKDSEAIYDVSPSWLPLLPAQDDVAINCCTERPLQTHEATDYAGLRLIDRKRK